MYLIELKDWKDGKLIEENDMSKNENDIKELRDKITNSNINILLKKSVDSLCMILSILLKTSYSNKFQNILPFSINNQTNIKLLSIINWTASNHNYIENINNQYRTKSKPYAKLFNIKTYSVITKNQAKQHFNWIA